MATKHYVIVGGSHGIGLAITQRLAANDAQVTVLSRTKERLGGILNVNHIPFDVTSDEFEASHLPRSIHGVAYCPGSINLGSIRSVKPEGMVEDFRLNVVGAVRAIQACLPGMKEAGTSAMIMFGTVAVAQGLKMHTSVAASKGAVESLTRTLAAELAPTIRVNCIAPALVDTPLTERLLSSEAKRSAMAEMYPLKRVGTVDDVAAMAEFLLSDQSSWITGQVFGVDGGLSTVRI